MTYRQIAHISRCSAGAVGAEMRAWKKEKAIEEIKEKELAEATAKIKLDRAYIPEVQKDDKFQGLSFDFSQNLPKIELELER